MTTEVGRQPSQAGPGAQDHSVRRVETLISHLLRTGVAVSLLIVVVGTLLSFAHHREYTWSSRSLELLMRSDAEFPHSVSQALREARGMRGRAWVTVGLLVLILTPVLRVAVSIVIFAHQRDRVFVVVTSIVFVLLMLSFLLGKAGG